MSLSKPFFTADEEVDTAKNNCLIGLLDKYIKSNDNLLPFQAYLQYIEDESLDVFSTVSCVKSQTNTLGNNLSTKEVPSLTNMTRSSQKAAYNSNLAATLVAINKNETVPAASDISPPPGNPDQEIILAQKLYKIIISIDYSAQISNIDFIQTSLTKVFEKLATEYDGFYRDCMQIEPTIYVTVILWNASFFQCPQSESSPKKSNLTDVLDDEFVPFTILCHAKRLLKSNISEIAAYIFDRFSEYKAIFLKLLKQMHDNQTSVAAAASKTEALVIDTSAMHRGKKTLNKKESHHRRGSVNTYHSEFGNFEKFLTNIIRMFSFFR